MNPCFSVVTITYNSERYLKECVNSVVQQDFTDFEHIIWDGGSKDGTLEIAQSYPHLNIFCGQDSGISDAMNKGAALAKGKYIIHLHSDDCLAHPQVLSQVDLLLKQHPQCDWCYGITQAIDDRGFVLRKNAFVPYSHNKLKRYNIISHPATFINRRLFLQIGGFNPRFRYAMDYDLWLRLAQETIPLAVPSVWACFREHANSLSTSRPLAVTDEAYRIRNQYVSTLWHRFQSYRTWQRRRRKL